MADVAAYFITTPDLVFNADTDTAGDTGMTIITSTPSFIFDTDPLNLLGTITADIITIYPSSGYINRVYDSVAVKVVNWRTEVPDPSGFYYPGPGDYGVDTSDYVVVKKVFS